MFSGIELIRRSYILEIMALNVHMLLQECLDLLLTLRQFHHHHYMMVGQQMSQALHICITRQYDQTLLLTT